MYGIGNAPREATLRRHIAGPHGQRQEVTAIIVERRNVVMPDLTPIHLDPNTFGHLHLCTFAFVHLCAHPWAMWPWLWTASAAGTMGTWYENPGPLRSVDKAE